MAGTAKVDSEMQTRLQSLQNMEDFAQVFGLYPDDRYRQRSYANIAAVL
jgi:hypothetical protein